MIEVDDLHIHYGTGRSRFEAVREVAFTIPDGGCYGLVGESGSGKSTVLNAIAGRHADWTGSIRVDGAPIPPRKRSAAQRRAVQIVFQDPFGAIHPKHTIGAIIAEPLVINRMDNKDARVDALLEQVGLPRALRYRYPHQLSGGQRQRVAIARALALESPHLLLDEPTSALDVSVQAEILNLLSDLRRERGLTYLLVTHDIGVVAHMCERVGVMQGGALVEELDVADLRVGRAQHAFTRELIQESSAAPPLG